VSSRANPNRFRPQDRDQTEIPGQNRRRRRQRDRSGATDPARPERAEAASPPPHPATDQGDRLWRDLTGSGQSQLSSDAALRARDADRPTPDELAAAEADTVVQRRHWAPPPVT
jgi:hypothetical protein